MMYIQAVKKPKRRKKYTWILNRFPVLYLFRFMHVYIHKMSTCGICYSKYFDIALLKGS